ncbi:MAG TPA: DUF4199 domain-containing protein [Thermoanaerobaculia bacterium]|nr:DUF4199 domain-containing protein [Thermoanaerobaculia bacterium]
MKKTVLTYGLISGVIAAVLMLAHVPFMDGSNKALLIGYAGILLSALVIFFGVRSYRENVGNGKISFGRGFAVGILIALISSACYVAAWEVVYFSNPAIANHIFDKQVEELRASGAPQAKIDETAREVESFKKVYSNPLVNAAFTFVEPFPVGLLVALISAVILRRK